MKVAPVLAKDSRHYASQFQCSWSLGIALSLVVFVILLSIALSRGLDNWGEAFAVLLWSSVCSGITGFILLTGRFNPYRFILFFLLALGTFFAVHFPPLAKVIEWPSQTSQALGSQIPICHISTVSIFGNIVVNQLSAIFHGPWSRWGFYYLLGIGYLGFTLLLGTGWCSWACLYGAWDESAARLAGKRPLWRLPLQPGPWRHIGLGILLTLLLLALVSREAIFCRWVCPFKLTSQFWDPDGFSRWLQITLILIVGVGFVLLLPVLTGRRIFCSYICPFGAWQSLVGRINPFTVKCWKKHCVQCGLCQSVCPVNAIFILPGKGPVILPYCNRCGQCIDICPGKALNITWKNQSQENFNFWPRVAFVLSAIIITGMLGIIVWGSVGRRLAQIIING